MMARFFLQEVKFKDGVGIGKAPVVGPKVPERITYIKPVSTTASSGLETFTSLGSASSVLNMISTGERESALYLTFTFEWDSPSFVEEYPLVSARAALLEPSAKPALVVWD